MNMLLVWPTVPQAAQPKILNLDCHHAPIQESTKSGGRRRRPPPFVWAAEGRPRFLKKTWGTLGGPFWHPWARTGSSKEAWDPLLTRLVNSPFGKTQNPRIYQKDLKQGFRPISYFTECGGLGRPGVRPDIRGAPPLQAVNAMRESAAR